MRTLCSAFNFLLRTRADLSLGRLLRGPQHRSLVFYLVDSMVASRHKPRAQSTVQRCDIRASGSKSRLDDDDSACDHPRMADHRRLWTDGFVQSPGAAVAGIIRVDDVHPVPPSDEIGLAIDPCWIRIWVLVLRSRAKPRRAPCPGDAFSDANRTLPGGKMV